MNCRSDSDRVYFACQSTARSLTLKRSFGKNAPGQSPGPRQLQAVRHAQVIMSLPARDFFTKFKNSTTSIINILQISEPAACKCYSFPHHTSGYRPYLSPQTGCMLVTYMRLGEAKLRVYVSYKQSQKQL